MKHLKKYKLFESVNVAEIDSLCEKYGIEDYIINSDGTIDVNNKVDLRERDLTKIPLKFRNVRGDFYCINNSLTSLVNSPKEVIGNFSFGNNRVSSFKDVPDIKGYLGCYNNLITSLDDLVWKNFDKIYIQSNPIALVIGFPTYSIKSISYNVNNIPDIHYLINNHWINSDKREEFIEYFVDMNIIQQDEDKPKLILHRLKEFNREIISDDYQTNLSLKINEYYKIIE